MALVGRFAPPLLLMALIFVLSAQPNLNSGLGGWDVLLRKLAHMIEYGLLWFLWWRALGYRLPALAVVITLGYAATDEWHQTMVTGRHGTPVDVLIDGAGIAVAATIVQLRTGALRRRRPAQAGARARAS